VVFRFLAVVDSLDLPQVILDIERKELDISAGLQDRVIQTYGGCVHMDFSGEIPAYTSLDPSLLPPMYLVYNTKTGKEAVAYLHVCVCLRMHVCVRGGASCGGI
jgi:hypothetical protein